MEDGGPSGGARERELGRSQGAKRGRGGAMRGSVAEAAWGQPPALPLPPQGSGAASRIYRTGAGGKDRHSKVYTSKGIRDRRVRLSVPTAISFYDLQDRLGYDQPSKAIEWLINAAAGAIEKLPKLDPAAFAAHPEPGAAKGKQQPQGSKSGGSSTSETSKGSELSLSRSDSRGAGTSASRDREVTVASTSAQATASFTELLTGVAEHSHRQAWQSQQNVSTAAADCVGIPHPDKGANGLSTNAFSALAGAVKFGNAPPFGMVPAQPFSFPISVEMPHFSLAQDALPAASAPAGDYNLNFSMSSGFLSANRGSTVQSSSQSNFSGHHQQLQRLDGQFLFGHGMAATAIPSSENQLTASAALQLWDGFRHSGMKEKSKN